MKDPKIETPHNQRDVLVFVLTVGWMMGRYENGEWKLYFSDTGLNTTKNQDWVVRWIELPDEPEGLIYPGWYHNKSQNK